MMKMGMNLFLSLNVKWISVTKGVLKVFKGSADN